MSDRPISEDRNRSPTRPHDQRGPLGARDDPSSRAPADRPVRRAAKRKTLFILAYRSWPIWWPIGEGRRRADYQIARSKGG